jgi:FkbM family methyltransferase
MSSAPTVARISYYPGATAMSGLYADPRRDRALVRVALLNAGFSAEQADERLEGRYEPRTLTCELTTVSSFLREQELGSVDLMKVDVERAELDVLAGIEHQDWAKLRQIVIEVHDDDGRCATIEDALAGRGFRVATEQDEAMRGTPVRMLYATRLRAA